MNRRQFVESLVAAAGLPVDRLAFGAWQASPGVASTPAPPVLWYPRAAARWVEALPIGNGRLGAMVFGDVGRERLQVNDDTLWSGGPAGWDRPDSHEAFLEIRKLTLAGNYVEADKLSRRLMGAFTQSYLPLGDVWLTFEHGNVAQGYRRQLDLADAMASVRYRIGDVLFTREIVASHPAGVIAVRLTTDRPGLLSFDATLSSPLRHEVVADASLLRLRGTAPAHVDPSYYQTDVPVQYGHDGGTQGGRWSAGEPAAPLRGRRTLPGMRFELALGLQTEGGESTVTPAGWRVREANAVTLIVATATGFNGFDKDPAREGRDPGPIVVSQVRRATATPWPQLREAHVADHRALFDRVSLQLPAGPAGDLPTDRRIADRGARDPGLVELLFQYGRYLLIACSRPGTQPANLQGLWNEEVRAPWSSNYTININTEMNYWPAETTGLPELHEPLLAFVGELAVNGRKTASSVYKARGWTAHHNSDLWRQSGMVGDWGFGDPVWATWSMGGPWLATHLYEHYLFGGDVAFLRDRAYPLLRGAAEFCLDSLVKDASGHLVTAPSTSPENRFGLPSGQTRRDLAGRDDGPGDDARGVRAHVGCSGRARHRRGVPEAPARGEGAIAAVRDRQQGPVARVGGGVRGARARPQAHLASATACTRAPTSRRRRRPCSPRSAGRTSCAVTRAQGGASRGR